MLSNSGHEGAAAMSTYSDFSAAQTMATSKDSVIVEEGRESKSSRPSKLTTDEEVLLMNIDYFEQWDRVYQKFGH